MLIRSAVPYVARGCGISAALSRRYRGQGTIFMLHSIVDDDAFYPDEMLRCPAGRLEWLLRWLTKQGMAFVSITEAIARLQEPQAGHFAAFTFDDGYADNLTHALPVMEKYNAPFTVYVTTGMVTGDIDAWWFGLAELIRRCDRIELSGKPFDCANPTAKQRTFLAIETMVHTDYSTLPAVKALIQAHGIDWTPLARSEGLTRDALRELAHHPLVTIGGHTTTHINLAQAPADVVEREMRENRTFLEDIIQAPVVHFAYPFGNADACGPREAKLAAAAGFRSAVTTRRGGIFPAHRDHLYALPREPVSRKDTASSMRCKIDGFYRVIHSRLGDPVARM
jgi:peptidoglycan/xylan/chitin deacetylase (PgdA/CDA1 family)